jgi:nitroreductase
MNDAMSSPMLTLPRADALAQRYGADAGLPSMPASSVIDALLRHRSVRSYLDKPLPPGALELMVAAAQSAATSSNLQAWSVVAVEDAARKQRLSVLAADQAHIRQCPLFLVWIADLSRLDRVAEGQGKKADGNRFLEMFLVAAIDAALAAQNAVVAAESLGLGGVYIGAIRNRPEEVAAELALPPDSMAVFGLCVGYPDPSRPADIKPRLRQSTIVHREQYSTQFEAAAVAEYNGRLNAFQAGQGMKRVDWTQQASARVAGPESLSGRHRMREALDHLGIKAQ